jgi:carbon storage regulator CsrA
VSEQIAIGADVSVELIEILKGEKVCLEIDCPVKTPVHRKEIYDCVPHRETDCDLS